MREVTEYLDSFLPSFARLNQPPNAHSHHHHHHHHHIHHATADSSATANSVSTGVTSTVQPSNAAPVQYLYHGTHLTTPSHHNASNSVSPNSATHPQVSPHPQHSTIQNSNVASLSPSDSTTIGAPVVVEGNGNAASTSASASAGPASMTLLTSPNAACTSQYTTNSYYAIVDVFQERTKPLGTLYCYNCGQPGHLGNLCTEKTLDDLTKSSKYILFHLWTC